MTDTQRKRVILGRRYGKTALRDMLQLARERHGVELTRRELESLLETYNAALPVAPKSKAR